MREWVAVRLLASYALDVSAQDYYGRMRNVFIFFPNKRLSCPVSFYFRV